MFIMCIYHILLYYNTIYYTIIIILTVINNNNNRRYIAHSIVSSYILEVTKAIHTYFKNTHQYIAANY